MGVYVGGLLQEEEGGGKGARGPGQPHGNGNPQWCGVAAGGRTTARETGGGKWGQSGLPTQWRHPVVGASPSARRRATVQRRRQFPPGKGTVGAAPARRRAPQRVVWATQPGERAGLNRPTPQSGGGGGRGGTPPPCQLPRPHAAAAPRAAGRGGPGDAPRSRAAGSGGDAGRRPEASAAKAGLSVAGRWARFAQHAPLHQSPSMPLPQKRTAATLAVATTGGPMAPQAPRRWEGATRPPLRWPGTRTGRCGTVAATEWRAPHPLTTTASCSCHGGTGGWGATKIGTALPESALSLQSATVDQCAKYFIDIYFREKLTWRWTTRCVRSADPTVSPTRSTCPRPCPRRPPARGAVQTDKKRKQLRIEPPPTRRRGCRNTLVRSPAAGKAGGNEASPRRATACHPLGSLPHPSSGRLDLPPPTSTG